MRRSLCFIILLFLTFPFGVEADRKILMLGGNGRQWGEKGNKVVAFDVTASNALQLREYLPYQNVLRVLDAFKDPVKVPIFGGWFVPWLPISVEQQYVPDEDPRAWNSEIDLLNDGNYAPDSGTSWTLTPAWVPWATWTFETGLPVRVNRFVFFPPQTGIAKSINTPFKDAYMRAYNVSATINELRPSDWNWPYPLLEISLRQEPNNFESIVVVDFFLQSLRFFRLQNIPPSPFSIVEVELYGEGSAPVARFTSKIIDLGEPVNIGHLYFDFKRFRQEKKWEWKGKIGESDPDEVKFEKKRRVIPELWQVVGGDPEPVPWSNAPVSIGVEVRSGKDDTPLVYHKIDDVGSEVVVTKEEYTKLLRGVLIPDPINNPRLPGQQGSVTDDTENWSQWSPPDTASGRELAVPDFRQYIQFRVTVKSQDPWAFGRIDSLWIDYSPPLVKSVVGEVAVVGEPQPRGGIAEVEGGQVVTLTYDIGAEFSSATQKGFDLVRILTPSKATLKGLFMGKPLREVTPARPVEWNEKNRTLEVYLPRKVTRANYEPIRVVFETVVLTYGTEFRGEVEDTGSQDLPQAIAPGNASDEVSTDQLQVLVTETSLKEVLTDVDVGPNPITPDGDGRNDTVTITYTLLRVTGDVGVDIGIYDLSGARVKTVVQRREGSGYNQVAEWDGKNEDRRLVRPGVYLCRIQINTDKGEIEKVRPVTVVY